jgi:C4-dicarboxylate-specific signal transduction histidine kinase
VAEIEITVEFPVDRVVFLERELKSAESSDDQTARERKLERRQEMDTADAMGVALRASHAVQSARECVEAIRGVRDELGLAESLIALAAPASHSISATLSRHASSKAIGG